MKTIGLLGGMTWESTVIYYQIVNREIQKRLGGLHSAKILMHSFDFEDVAALQSAGKWDEAGAYLAAAGRGLAQSGAGFLVLCCNTMHCVSEAIEKEAGVPLLHIADPLGAAIRGAGLSRVGLLGTRYTMEMPGVVRQRLAGKYGLSVLVPDGEDAAELHRIIYEELGRGKFLDSSRAACRRIIGGLVARGAQGIVLGCTELPLILAPDDSPVPQFDTLALHAMVIADLALS
ncbi:MAG: aspartate/glutamate racemase family protein [Alphaproteobacteria bacterium]|nr:aspartate/glutamate racemase family protein [Alphaproteobacteria bacterium]MDE2495503.1 aspartate/glutamate racemase family protein [Alphaproteobacteria bacterium]MDE2500042.1 aspartate/glutamate racemase family protein [Alphaproteobacteria bacterium]